MRNRGRRSIAAVLGAMASAAAVVVLAPLAFAAIEVGYGNSVSPLANDSAPHTTIATCPAGMEVLGGGVRLGDDLNDFVQGTYPVGETGWAAVGYRRNTQPAPSSLEADAICLRGAKVATKSVTVPLNGVGTIDTPVVKCPKGTLVAGGGGQLSDETNDYLAGSFPFSKREWIVIARGGGDVTPTARCVRKVDLKIRAKSITMPDDNTTHTVTAKCPKRMKATGGGGRLEDPLFNFFQGSYPTGRSKWTAAGYDAGKLTAYVICRKKYGGD